MKIPHFTATRFEQVITEGRTHPVVLACRSDEPADRSRPLLVKAIGCPEIHSTWQLVTEVVSNAAARNMGVRTPAPAVVSLSETVAKQINQSLNELGHRFEVQPGFASGCDFITNLVPFTVDQLLTPELRDHATKLFVFDMASQNPDRRRSKVNCGLNKGGLVAFDFELCFAHKFLPVIGGSSASAWLPSNSQQARNHLFYSEVKANPPQIEQVESMVESLTSSWWNDVMDGVPDEWREPAQRIGGDLLSIAQHKTDFAKDITMRCLQ